MIEPKTVPIKSLQVSDLEKHSVWQFAIDERADDTAVRPVTRLPVSTLAGKIVGTRVRLANGEYRWGIVSNLDARNPEMNEHFLALSMERNGRWFHLARYFDSDYGVRGPKSLARFLGFPVDDVFPICYDVRKCVKGHPAALAGSILREPRVRLTRAEIIGMAVPKIVISGKSTIFK
jgi:hypothetical protein